MNGFKKSGIHLQKYAIYSPFAFEILIHIAKNVYK